MAEATAPPRPRAGYLPTPSPRIFLHCRRWLHGHGSGPLLPGNVSRSLSDSRHMLCIHFWWMRLSWQTDVESETGWVEGFWGAAASTSTISKAQQGLSARSGGPHLLLPPLSLFNTLILSGVGSIQRAGACHSCGHQGAFSLDDLLPSLIRRRRGGPEGLGSHLSFKTWRAPSRNPHVSLAVELPSLVLSLLNQCVIISLSCSLLLYWADL